MYRYTLFRKGVSELLAITIGVAITIAIGVMLYMFMPNFLSSTAQQQKLGLTIISANAVDDQTVIVSMSLRNLGTKAINGVNISILNIDVNISRILTPLKASIDRNNLYLDLSINPLAPGQEIPIVIEVKSKIIAIGQKINIVVIARYVDGTFSASSITATIM
jgi:hypothetical protein